MANFKFRITTIGADLNSFTDFSTDPDIVAARERTNLRALFAKKAYIENDSPDTSPHQQSVVNTILDDGRHQRVRIYTGFETQEEVETYIDYCIKNNPDGPIYSSWNIANDIRSKIEIIDNDNAVLSVVHDNTTLDQYTINGFVETPDDPFYLEA